MAGTVPHKAAVDAVSGARGAAKDVGLVDVKNVQMLALAARIACAAVRTGS